jgi:hypothetical protein
MAPEAGLGCCQPHPGRWHSSRSSAGGAVFLLGQSVEGRSDCGHFGLVDWRACIRIRCQAILALNAPAIQSVGVTPGFRRQTECEPCTCQDRLFTYTAVT